MKAIRVIFAFVVLMFILRTSVFAATISITNIPTSITDQPFTLTASVSGETAGTNFLKVDIYKDGTSNYFGETNNGSIWYSGGNGSSYYPITINDSNFGSGTFQAKIGIPNSNDYPGSGAYKVRIRRFTSSGQVATNDSQSPVDVTITFTLPSPTPTLTLTPTPTPVLSNTPTPTVNLTITPVPTVDPAVPQTATTANTNQQVLGQTAADNSLFAIPSGTDNKDKNIALFTSSDKQSLTLTYSNTCTNIYHH